VGEVATSWTLDVDPGLTEEAELRVRLRLERSEVFGRIRFPRFELGATSIVQRRFAGSADPPFALSLDIDAPGTLAIDPVEFAYDWPELAPPTIAAQQMET